MSFSIEEGRVTLFNKHFLKQLSDNSVKEVESLIDAKCEQLSKHSFPISLIVFGIVNCLNPQLEKQFLGNDVNCIGSLIPTKRLQFEKHP